jgi:hypothetical protein
MPDFMKIRAVEAEVFHADGWSEDRTDVTKSKVALRSVANVLYTLPVY